jgi:hypothetical protein
MTNPSSTVQKLEIIPLRQAFPHEALHFTTWLEANIDALTDRLGIKLSDIQREQAVGDFSVDLVGQGADGRRVIIENQLERTDHSHLGQLLTYLVNLDASIAIWVAAEPRLEHAKVINWLNESTPADISFYLVKVEAARIGDSSYAPLFTVLARPDVQTKEIGEKKKEWAERHYSRYEFWKGLLEKSKPRTKLFANISPSKDSWISTGSGKAGIVFIYHIRLGEGTVELYIDHDQNTGERNKQIFDILHSQKGDIEQEYGEPLEWDRNNSKRVSQIRKRFNNGGLALPDTWSNLQDQMIDAMIRFDGIFRPRIAQIKI